MSYSFFVYFFSFLWFAIFFFVQIYFLDSISMELLYFHLMPTVLLLFVLWFTCYDARQWFLFEMGTVLLFYVPFVRTANNIVFK